LNYIGNDWPAKTPFSERGPEAQCHTMSQLGPNSLRRLAVQQTASEHTAAWSGWRPCVRSRPRSPRPAPLAGARGWGWCAGRVQLDAAQPRRVDGLASVPRR